MILMDDGVNQFKLEDFDMRPLRNHTAPSQAPFDYQTIHIPGRVGDWVFGAEINPVIYELQANTIFKDLGELEKRLDDLNAFLFDQRGQPKEIKFSFDYSEKFFYARLAENIIPDIATIMEKIPIKFINFGARKFAKSDAYDPETPLLYNTGHMYDMPAYPNTTAFDWIYQSHYSGLANWSSLNTDLKITITGRVRNGKVKHLGTNNELSIPNITNGTVVINSKNYLITVNGNEHLDLDGEFPFLVPSDNGFLFTADEVNAQVAYEWVHTFM